jgi:hypothetical protein
MAALRASFQNVPGACRSPTVAARLNASAAMAASHDLTAVLDAHSMSDASAAALELAPASRAPASTPGFAVRLPCAQLGDLIQINCLNRIRGAFRVSSGQGEGFLFFESGQLVHASCGDQVGLDAVVVMLGWRSGSIEPSELAWPAQSSIGMGADALLLHAAQRQDERARDASQHDATTKVVRRVAHPDEARHDIETVPLAERRSEQSGIALRSPFAFEGSRNVEEVPNAAMPIGRDLGHEALSRLEITRVAPNGKIERLKAGASTDLADTAFFCQRLATLVGEGLGLGPCRALACESSDEGIVVFQGRSIVGARGALADLEFVLAKVGLA